MCGRKLRQYPSDVDLHALRPPRSARRSYDESRLSIDHICVGPCDASRAHLGASAVSADILSQDSDNDRYAGYGTDPHWHTKILRWSSGPSERCVIPLGNEARAAVHILVATVPPSRSAARFVPAVYFQLLREYPRTTGETLGRPPIVETSSIGNDEFRVRRTAHAVYGSRNTGAHGILVASDPLRDDGYRSVRPAHDCSIRCIKRRGRAKVQDKARVFG